MGALIAIVAVDKNWGIGYRGQLLQRIPEDMKRFRQKTVNKIVVMGRETFESLPGKQPLKDRINIVISRNINFNDNRIALFRSVEELLNELKKYSPQDIFIIGGESVYRQLLPFCSEAYVTKIQNEYKADCYFPDIDKEPSWKLQYKSGLKTYGDVGFYFTKYLRIQNK